MEKIKVIVASHPRLMREIMLEMISSQPDIEVVAEVQDENDIARMVEELRPDWLLLAINRPDQRPDICNSLFDRQPTLKILALASENNNCVFYWATINIRSIRVESSERGILDALRGRRPALADVFETPISKKVN